MARQKGSIDSPFVVADAPTLADVIAMLDQDSGQSETQRRDQKSALRRLAELIGRAPEMIPANINWLHVRLRRTHPRLHGISKKTFSNLKSAALKALERTGCSRKRSDWQRRPNAEWADLLDSVANKHDRWRLSQFAQFCSAIDIGPREVSDTHLLGMRTALIEESFVDKPEHIAANAVKTWNRLRSERRDWPDIGLAQPPKKREPWTYPLDQFPTSFQADVAQWVDRLRNPDLFDDTGPPKPLRETTIQHRLFQIRQMASAIVRSGTPISVITDLAALVDLDNLKAGLRWMMARFNNKPTEAIHGLSAGLLAIARHHVRAEECQIRAIQGIVKRLNHGFDGLREKNRIRLLQLEDPHNLAKLLHLPSTLEQKSRQLRIKKLRKAALLLQAALAIEILLFAPMRIGNLACLHLERHLRPIKSRRDQRTLIHIPAEEVKNARALDFELGPVTTRLLERYLREARPVLLDAPSGYLFPAGNGEPKRTDALSRLISSSIRDHAGLDINAHLFRSIAGKIHSLAAPGDFATLSHVIGDSLQTAMSAYAQFERRTAIEHFQKSVEAARTAAPHTWRRT
ncbi:MAG: hypothetical protein AAFR01_07250 [Pseudomonadota bacterium]